MDRSNLSIKMISMYLPQYHPIPENDAWWGKGFTEWTNLRKAKPRFSGHYQPHVPERLGYYDLRDPKDRAAQAQLARTYGIHGFCYYHYWFNGKRLLETPFNEVLKSGEPDFPFCICWANENWTRRWDGLDQEVLMGQKYSDEDSLNFINDLIPTFRDERYIRVNGKPLLLIYRTGLIPDPKKTTDIWRGAMIKAGIGDLYIVRVENFMHGAEPSPEDLGFDAAMEFAPYWGSVGNTIKNLKEVCLPEQTLDEDLIVYDYAQVMRNMLARPVPSYKLFRGVFPGWDNSARRKIGPTIFANSSPDKYAYWLSQVARNTLKRFEGDERLLFVNAWNEWGEGCHLEPDERYGTAYLEATRMALQQAQDAHDILGSLTPLLDQGDEATFAWFESLRKVYEESVELTERDKSVLNSFKNLIINTNPEIKADEEAERNLREIIRQKDQLISNLRNSLSWRITAPLRNLVDKLRG